MKTLEINNGPQIGGLPATLFIGRRISISRHGGHQNDALVSCCGVDKGDVLYKPPGHKKVERAPAELFSPMWGKGNEDLKALRDNLPPIVAVVPVKTDVPAPKPDTRQHLLMAWVEALADADAAMELHGEAVARAGMLANKLQRFGVQVRIDPLVIPAREPEPLDSQVELFAFEPPARPEPAAVVARPEPVAAPVKQLKAKLPRVNNSTLAAVRMLYERGVVNNQLLPLSELTSCQGFGRYQSKDSAGARLAELMTRVDPEHRQFKCHVFGKPGAWKLKVRPL
jgi:hypothetical protein